jgi:diaminopimelate decarboxylase
MFAQIKTTLKMSILNYIHRRDEQERQRLPRHGELSPSLWDVDVNKSGHMQIGGCDVAELAQQYGTPLHVVDKKRLIDNYHRFYNSFYELYPKVKVSLSYKTNPLPGVFQTLHEVGAESEVISEFELWLALKLGVPPGKIILNGPAKTNESLEMAISKNIKLINIDNLNEIEKIDQLSKKYQIKQDVAVRVITSVGWASQFGLSIARGDAYKAFERLTALPLVNPCAIHIHLGTGIKNLQTYLKAIREVLDFSKDITHKLGVNFKYFDFGGGFGVSTVKELSEIDEKLLLNGFPIRLVKEENCPPIEDYAKGVVNLVSQYYEPSDNNAPTLVFEPGRAIMSSAQVLLLKVLNKKDTGIPSIENIILDGGKNITMPLAYEFHEIFAATKINNTLRQGYYNLFGPLCHPSDIVFKMKKMPELSCGDIVAVMDAGAYFIPNQMNFSNPRPPVIMVEKGKHWTIRKRESFEDIVSLDNFGDNHF